ncbi:MAG: hypothetical protein WA030_02915 [Candidatus Microsaccharimonas sp.]
MTKLSDKSYEEFKNISEKEGIKYDSELEMKQSADNLVKFVDLLIEMDMQQRALKKRLETEPKGFSMEGEGRNCSLCGQMVYGTSGWYDKWGFKCMNCQKAVDTKKIPGSLCGDYNHEKCIPDTSLAYKTGLHIQTIRKLIRQGKIKARPITGGPNMILRKDNPGLPEIIEDELRSKRTPH